MTTDANGKPLIGQIDTGAPALPGPGDEPVDGRGSLPLGLQLADESLDSLADLLPDRADGVYAPVRLAVDSPTREFRQTGIDESYAFLILPYEHARARLPSGSAKSATPLSLLNDSLTSRMTDAALTDAALS
ncbi:hypothetical protein [Actinomadura luteofluorescens]|uniref:hypothetical protein n=1 Tax=Actinomadura luteofluorescens TaxID=46163 RepID=UPI003D91CDD3